MGTWLRSRTAFSVEERFARSLVLSAYILTTSAVASIHSLYGLGSKMAPPSVISSLMTLCLLVSSAFAAIVNYDFNISWVTAQPDGFSRPTIGINGEWPIPQITANVGDRVIVNVVNGLGNQTTSLHFHGLYMNGTPHMDGPVSVTQCSIPPGGYFVYDFNVSAIDPVAVASYSMPPDQPTWNILVSFARLRPISRWPSWCTNRQGSALALQGSVR